MIYDDILKGQKIENAYQKLDFYNIQSNNLYIKYVASKKISNRRHYIICNREYYVEQEFDEKGLHPIKNIVPVNRNIYHVYQMWILEIAKQIMSNNSKLVCQHYFYNVLNEK